MNSIGPVRLPYARPLPAAGAAHAREPADHVELRGTLWREVDRLDLWTSCSLVGGPLAGVLSATAQDELRSLFRDVEAKGLTFGFCLGPDSRRMMRTKWPGSEACEQILSWDDPQGRLDRLNLVGEGIDHAPVTSFRDLKALEAFTTGRLSARQQRLKDLEEAGGAWSIQYLDERETRPIGSYGADRAWPSERLRLNGTPVQNERDLEMAEFFLLGAPHKELDRDPRACTLRQLQREGFRFLRGAEREPVDAMAAYHHGVVRKAGDVKVCLEDGLAPQALMINGERMYPVSERLKRLVSFPLEGVPPRERRDFLRALTLPGDMPLEERFRIMGELRQSEASSGSALFAAEQLQKAGNPPVHEYQELRRKGLALDTAGEALVYFRNTLPSLTFGPEDYAAEREAIVELAQIMPKLPEALKARALLQQPAPEPYPERLEVLRQLKNLDDYTAALQGGLPLEPSAEALLRLKDREAFAFLARGVKRQVFPSLEQAVERYLRELEVARDPALAREFCLSEDPPRETLTRLYDALDEETARRVFKSGRAEELLPELELTGDVELAEKSLALPEPYAERARLSDYVTLVRYHREGAPLQEESAALNALKEVLPEAEVESAYQALQAEGGDVKRFLRERALGRDDRPPLAIGQEGRNVIVGGIRLPRK